jgi:hypothetical protein
MTQYFLDKKKKEFEEYFNTKLISPSISKKFIAALNSHIKNNKQSFVDFYEFILANKSFDIEKSLRNTNSAITRKKKGYKTILFVAEWSHSYLGQGEILSLLINENTKSGGKRHPDILFKNSDRKIEVKAYAENFRLTESTYFFTDLGTIIQALVQGGFLLSLTDINNNDIRKGLRYFCESFLAPRGYIELNSQVWKLQSKTDKTIVFKASPETPREMVKYSVVRNSLRNWLSRGLLSIKLAAIIDPTRASKIQKREVHDYVANILGTGELTPIPLEQYFGLCGLESILLYESKNKIEPFQLIKYNDLNLFSIDRIGQSKVSYKKKLSNKIT